MTLMKRPIDPPPVAAQPAFYAHTGSARGDLLTVLHAPYTVWHLAYVAVGAALVSELDWFRLGATLLVFLLGTGIAAHALDEWNGRPLGTGLSDRVLIVMAGAALVLTGLITVGGMIVISPWVAAWAVIGTLLMLGYTLEWHRLLHSDVTFALAWGGFPVLVGYWAQAESVAVPAVLVAGFAVGLSLAQRALSTSARRVRRRAPDAGVLLQHGAEAELSPASLLDSWEAPLRWLAVTVIVLAAGLLATHL